VVNFAGEIALLSQTLGLDLRVKGCEGMERRKRNGRKEGRKARE